MYAVYYKDEWVTFNSLLEAEEFVEKLYNKGETDEMLDIVSYNWRMGTEWR